jgi:hypothetical protein
VIGLPIVVCHFPRGTGKWNKIEHRLFSFISHNWRGKRHDHQPDHEHNHKHRPEGLRPPTGEVDRRSS